jgi:3-hydroxyisobutyrate dehydrogenase-like beta-hydroxyacid dehydrogenase
VEAGFLGVGNMGLPMATRLLDGGHRLTVHDIRERGRTVTVAGDKPGAAQVLKLTNNILSAVALAATAEVRHGRQGWPRS